MTNGFDLSQDKAKSQFQSGIAQPGFQALQRLGFIIMSRKGRDRSGNVDEFSTFTNSVRDRRWDCCTSRLSHQFTTFRVRIPDALTQLASASMSARSGMQMQPVPG